jgi:hypothetical protein
MNVYERLQQMANRLGLVRIVQPAPRSSPPTVRTQSLSLAELMTHIQRDQVQALGGGEGEIAVPLDRIYEAAGVVPASGPGALDRLLDELKQGPCANLARIEAQQAVSQRLTESGMAAEAVIREAMARDRALDAYEAAGNGRLQARQEQRQHERQAISDEIARLEARRRQIDAQAQAEAAAWDRWRQAKRQAEDDLAWLVGFVVDEQPITHDR